MSDNRTLGPFGGPHPEDSHKSGKKGTSPFAAHADHRHGGLGKGYEPYPTGPLSGGLITITGTQEVTIAAGTGVIVNSWEDPLDITHDAVSWVEQPLTISAAPLRAYSYVYIDPAGVFLYVTSPPQPDFLRKNIFMARIVHDIETGALIGVRPAHMVPGGTAQMFADFMVAIGIPLLVKGADVTGNVDLTFDTTATQWFGPGESWQQDKDDPNIANNPAGVPQQFYYMKSDGVLEPTGIQTDVEPDAVEDTLTNIISPVGGSPNQATIQRLWTSISGTYVMTYGQQIYPTLEEARNAISSDNAVFVMPQYLADERATLVAYFVMEKSATDLLNGIDVVIVAPEGTPVSGGAAGSHTHDTAYLRLDAANDPMQAALDMGGFLINGVAYPVAPTDAATKNYVDTQDPHDLHSTRHTDVDTSVPVVTRHVLASQPTDGDYRNEFRANWRNKWIAGVYYTHDMVRDEAWTMIANKQTSDRAAPQPLGASSYVYKGPPTTTSNFAKQVLFGQRYTISILSEITGYRVFVVTGNTYEVYTITDPDGDAIVTLLSSFTASSTGWQDINIAGGLVTPGFEFDLVALVAEPDPTPTIFTGNWDYDTPQNPTAPPSGVIRQANSTPGVLAVHKFDNDGGDRSVELATMTVGDVIQFDQPDGTRYSVQAIGDQGTYINFSVAPSVQSTPDGVTSFAFETVTATPITNLNEPDWWTLNPPTLAVVKGVLQIDDGPYSLDGDAYGTDILIQEYDASPDWDVVATSGGVAGGSEGGGTNPLPPGGNTDDVLSKIDAQDYNVEWAPVLIPPQTYLHDDLTDVGPDQHHTKYTDQEAIDAVGPHTPAQTFLHDDLTDVTTDQHHAQVHATEGADHNSGAALDGQILTADGASGQTWETPVAGVTDHALLSNVTTDQHHSRYTDGEAAAAAPVQEAPEDGTPYARQDAGWVPGSGSGVFLPLSGGTMSGNINMGDNYLQHITNLYLSDVTTSIISKIDGAKLYFLPGGDFEIEDSTSAAIFKWLQIASKFEFTRNVDMTAHLIEGVLDPVAAQDAATKNYVDTAGLYLPLTGGTLTGHVILSAVTPTNILWFETYREVGGVPNKAGLGVSADTPGSALLRATQDGVVTNLYVGDGQVLHPSGSAAAPGVSFNDNTGAGLYAIDDVLYLTSLGKYRLQFSAAYNGFRLPDGSGWQLVMYPDRSEFRVAPIRVFKGTASAPGYGFYGTDADYGMYKSASGVGLTANGILGIELRPAGDVRITKIQDYQTASAANVQAGSSGRLSVSTSARRFKTDIALAPQLADLTLEPVTFHHPGDNADYIGFIADDMPDDRAIVYDEDGDVQSYDTRAVVAILAAKVNRLENA